LISQLQPLIRNASDATIIVPLIKEYLDVAVKNDDHLVKLTAIVQRYISTTQTITGDSSILSESEKVQLLKVAEKEFEDELSDEIVKLDDEDKELNDKISNVKKSLENSNDE
jgi:predicted HTH domain antitoxin